MKKKDILAIAKEIAKIIQPGQNPAMPELKDKIGRRRRPVMKGGRFLFYCNETDLAEFRKICWDKDKGVSEVLREKVTQVLKDAGVEPKDKG